ncbi:hypothetical protein FNU79_02515 [Deinococcus detaillensis]|uniref:Uncharacterized protein n=1 Tax=Deinococcus detaillensis TaxID=2592048 RepID=A0A553V6Q6_9DEIO|nr:hypothetical protein [Deinococcus detaillensis]TSA88116.1 hypothetical protein FNU79_02515 [Deinococcus detaillensis]
MTNKAEGGLPDGYSGESDTTPDATIQEGMQGGTGEMDANGLAPDFDSGEKMEELKENLGSEYGADK